MTPVDNYSIYPDFVDIDVPEVDEPGSSHDVSMYTRLFRGGNYLGDALRLANERTGERADLTVYSVGCSNGAEVDTILALHKLHKYAGKIVIKGFDLNELALQYAEAGIYLGYSHYDEQQADLTLMGFDVDKQPCVLEEDDGLIIGSHRLRKDHVVSFERHDARKPFTDEGNVDLVLVNNVLYHLETRKEILDVVSNTASLLGDRGIISFGSSLLRGCNRINRKTVRECARLLKRNFELVPVYRSEAGEPIMLGRDLHR
jgi:chemotaxis methyl-accepting protein methylase